MPLCSTTGCGCAITSESLQISGSGGVGNPYTIETNAFAIVTSVTRPSTPFTNQFIFETDTGLSWMWDGSDWLLFAYTTTPRFQGQSVSESVNHNETEVLEIDAETDDPFDWHSVGTPTRVTPDIPGKYRVFVAVAWQSATDYTRTLVGCRLNGTAIQTGRTDLYVAAGYRPLGIHATYDSLALNGSTDYIEPEVYHANLAEVARTVTMRISVEWIGNP